MSTYHVIVLYILIRDKVAGCAKHFVGDGGTTKGINENNTVIDWHGLLSIHMPGYYQSVIKGVSTIMVSYSSWNGKKMHANRRLVTGFLKNTLKFKVKHFSLYIFREREKCNETRINLWNLISFQSQTSFQNYNKTYFKYMWIKFNFSIS